MTTSPTKTKHSKIERADLAVADATGKSRDTVAVKALGTLSELADQPQLISICAVTLAAGLLAGNARLARAGARMLAAELLATKLKSFVKHRVDRTRPHVVANGGRYKAKPGSSHASALNSFPSGHTAGAVAVARAFVREYPEHRVAAYVCAAAVAAIQIPRSAHYPTDVTAGGIVGLLAEAAIDRVTPARRHAKPAE